MCAPVTGTYSKVYLFLRNWKNDQSLHYMVISMNKLYYDMKGKFQKLYKWNEDKVTVILNLHLKDYTSFYK